MCVYLIVFILKSCQLCSVFARMKQKLTCDINKELKGMHFHSLKLNWCQFKLNMVSVLNSLSFILKRGTEQSSELGES